MTTIATTNVTVPRGRTAAWDLPVDASPGLATLAARYLSDRRSGSVGHFAAANNWIIRHGMLPGRSCFSFWAPDITEATGAEIGAAARRARLEPTLLNAVKRAQLIQAARRADDPSHAIERAVHAAAWAEARCPDDGDHEATLASIDGDAVSAYLGTALPRASLTIVGADVDLPTAVTGRASPVPQRTWAGGLKLVHRPWAQIVVGVQVCFDPVQVGPAALAVLRELLGGRAGGLLADELRAIQGLAYGTGATARVEHGWATVLACANTDREHVAVCARALTRIVAQLPETPASRWRAGAQQARLRAVEALEQPFAAVDEFRRANAGAATLRELSASAEEAAERLIACPPVPAGRVACAIVGGLDDALNEELERWS